VLGLLADFGVIGSQLLWWFLLIRRQTLEEMEQKEVGNIDAASRICSEPLTMIYDSTTFMIYCTIYYASRLTTDFHIRT
jgi:hypothetical protein